MLKASIRELCRFGASPKKLLSHRLAERFFPKLRIAYIAFASAPAT
jgi:hypothetical protein